jgi:hypothetical protein
VVDDVGGYQHFEVDRAPVPAFIEAAHDVGIVRHAVLRAPGKFVRGPADLQLHAVGIDEVHAGQHWKLGDHTVGCVGRHEPLAKLVERLS